MTFKVGNIVTSAIPGDPLHCGSGIYAAAVVASVEPFTLVSMSGDMVWYNRVPEKMKFLREGTPTEVFHAYKRFLGITLVEPVVEEPKASFDIAGPENCSWISEHSDAAAVIQATHEEEHRLWNDFNGCAGVKSARQTWFEKAGQEVPSFKEFTRGGPMIQLGKVDGRPICVCLNAYKVQGRTVIFVNATSQLVDYKMVDDFVRHYWPKADTSNVTNFHNALRHIERLNEEDAK